MSSTPSYGQRARQAYPGYARPGTPCDVDGCDQPVAGDRTLTAVGARREDDVSILIRLCARHLNARRKDLGRLLPMLPSYFTEGPGW